MLAYLRVSTDEQATSGLGLEGQEAMLRRAFDYRGWERVDTIRDEGISGSTLERPGLFSALERIAGGEADGLVVAKLDRLTRSVRNFCELVDWFEEAEAGLVVLDPEVDTSNTYGRAMAHVMVTFAELERGMIADRTRAALAAKRERGEQIGLPSVSDEPGLVERIQELRASGLSLQKIADKLNAADVPTMRGAVMWRPSSVQVAAGWRRRPPRRRHPALPPIDRRRRAA